MNYFTQDYIDFFTELAFNNEKSWFDVNRKRYEQSVREPFKSFTEAIIDGIYAFDPSIGHLEPKHVMFRINRDIRFAKDKTPYNTWLSAAIVRGGKRNDESHPGYYFRFAVDKVQIGGGVFHPSKEHLHAIRSNIAKNSKALHSIIDAKEFKKHGETYRATKTKLFQKSSKQQPNQNRSSAKRASRTG